MQFRFNIVVNDIYKIGFSSWMAEERVDCRLFGGGMFLEQTGDARGVLVLKIW